MALKPEQVDVKAMVELLDRRHSPTQRLGGRSMPNCVQRR
jgi:hypothetical protein